MSSFFCRYWVEQRRPAVGGRRRGAGHARFPFCQRQPASRATGVHFYRYNDSFTFHFLSRNLSVREDVRSERKQISFCRYSYLYLSALFPSSTQACWAISARCTAFMEMFPKRCARQSTSSSARQKRAFCSARTWQRAGLICPMWTGSCSTTLPVRRQTTCIALDAQRARVARAVRYSSCCHLRRPTFLC